MTAKQTRPRRPPTGDAREGAAGGRVLRRQGSETSRRCLRRSGIRRRRRCGVWLRCGWRAQLPLTGKEGLLEKLELLVHSMRAAQVFLKLAPERGQAGAQIVELIRDSRLVHLLRSG
jgi:hypothetical protein